MTDFGFDDVEDDEPKRSARSHKGKWVDKGGYLPTPARGYPWKCDCVAGNPVPDKIILNPMLHNFGCPVRNRMSDKTYVKRLDIFGRDLEQSVI